MGDHLALYVDRLVTSSTLDSTLGILGSCRPNTVERTSLEPPKGAGHEIIREERLGGGSCSSGTSRWDTELAAGLAECRICQEEDETRNLESPCACSGSLKYAHRKCVQRWCNEKGDTLCEICHQPYKSGYTAPPRPVHSDSIPIDIGGNWGITGGHNLDFHDPRILAMAAERHFLDADYDEYAAANASGAACFRSAALILMALLLLRHALAMTASGADDDASTYFTLFLLRAAGFLLPCYIMARAMNILQRRRQRQEAAMAAAEVALLLQTGQARGMHFAIAPGPSPARELP